MPPRHAGADAAAQQAVGGCRRSGCRQAARHSRRGGPPPGDEIDERYQALRDYVGAAGQAAPIDRVLKAMNDLQQQTRPAGAAPAGAAAGGAAGDDPALALQAEAHAAPQPVARWLLAIAESRHGAARRRRAPAGRRGVQRRRRPGRCASGRWRGAIRSAAGAASDIPLDDFARLFAPGGLIDAFFTTQLRPFVDTSGRVWKSNDGTGAPVGSADLDKSTTVNQAIDHERTHEHTDISVPSSLKQQGLMGPQFRMRSLNSQSRSSSSFEAYRFSYGRARGDVSRRRCMARGKAQFSV